jgi:hypothetical protein
MGKIIDRALLRILRIHNIIISRLMDKTLTRAEVPLAMNNLWFNLKEIFLMTLVAFSEILRMQNCIKSL